MFSIPACDFSLSATLASGQVFRWHAHDGWFYGYVDSRAVRLRQEGDQVVVHTAECHLEPDVIRTYFALEANLPEILRSIDVDAQIHQAILAFRGLRVLRQDPWECLASFICSSYNNVRRITGMIERLCQAFGTPVALNGFRGCRFPPPEAIARTSEARLRQLGLGYRAAYLRATARLVADGKLRLDRLRDVDYQTAKAALLRCDGVGDKVADCVALFALQHEEAFPIDLWIRRAMRYYFGSRRMTPGRLHAFAAQHFGRYAGYAQQYLYHYVRTSRASHKPSAPSTKAKSGSLLAAWCQAAAQRAPTA